MTSYIYTPKLDDDIACIDTGHLSSSPSLWKPSATEAQGTLSGRLQWSDDHLTSSSRGFRAVDQPLGELEWKENLSCIPRDTVILDQVR